jgi:cytochrome c-type biogenesis protein CcmE
MDVSTEVGPRFSSVDAPDDRDLDEGGLDLSPRPTGAARLRRGPGRRWLPLLVLVVLAGALGFIVFQARGATLYFKNADEAVAQKASLGTKDFRLQGTVVSKRSRPVDGAIEFTVAYKGVSVRVRHSGSEPAMFKPGIPVVAEGHWNDAGTLFESHRLLVKHDADYKTYDKDNPGRVDPSQSTNK